MELYTVTHTNKANTLVVSHIPGSLGLAGGTPMFIWKSLETAGELGLHFTCQTPFHDAQPEHRTLKVI